MVRRLARAADDGYTCDLVPGVRATADAELLCAEVAFAVARLDELRISPVGLFADAAALAADGRREEGLWLVAQIAAISPRESWQGSADDEAQPFTAITTAAVPWAGGAAPSVPGSELGPRACTDVETTLTAYRAWAARGGGQAAALAGDPAWTQERRFDRAFERLALPGFTRGARYEFLLLAGALGLAEISPASLHLMTDQRDPVLAAAKRVFGFGDPIVLARRAGELAVAAGVSMGALDLALLNWARLADKPGAGRVTGGSRAAPDEAARARVAQALAVSEAPTE